MILQGHAIEKLRELPDESVHCVVTSPPYWGLRDYGIEPVVWDDPGDCQGHEWGESISLKAKSNWDTFDDYNTDGNPRVGIGKKDAGKEGNQGQFCIHCSCWLGSLGLEPTPELFIQHIVQVFREVRRVLHPSGTLWLNMGDSYATSPPGNKGKHALGEIGDGAYQRRWDRQLGHGEDKNTIYKQTHGLKPKDLCMIPARVAIALQSDGWWIRSQMPWVKRNSMPESCRDRPATAIEYVYLLSKSQKYFWDAEAIRIPHSEHSLKHNPGAVNRTGKDFPKMGATGERNKGYTTGFNPSGRNFRNSDLFFQSWQGLWIEDDAAALIVNPQPFKKAHFATFSEKLVEPLIKAGSSEKGCCPVCRGPWVRVVEKDAPEGATGDWRGKDNSGAGSVKSPLNHYKSGYRGIIETRTLGWRPGCKHEEKPIPCTVLDPFGGAMTVPLVAEKLWRSWVAIEINPDYIKMGEERLRPYTEQKRLF